MVAGDAGGVSDSIGLDGVRRARTGDDAAPSAPGAFPVLFLARRPKRPA